MVRAVLFVVVAAACGRSDGIADDKLGGLVVETKRPDITIDVVRAASDPAELSRALARPSAQWIAAIGPHAIAIDTSTTVDEAGKAVSTLSDHTVVEIGAGGAFHGLYTNSADYGREAIFVGGKLYLRPRYQRWHGRAPETLNEPQALRDEYYSAIGATWDLVGFGAELSDRGAVQVGGRSGRKIEVKLSPEVVRPSRETLSQRRWREGRTLQALAGEVVLDAETGVPLSITLAASLQYSREARRFVMKVKLASTLTEIGKVAAIAAPPETEVVATPSRLGEVDDRDTLLQGIAPPTRSSEGSAARPPASDAKPRPAGKPPDSKPAAKPPASDAKPQPAGKPPDSKPAAKPPASDAKPQPAVKPPEAKP